jgi:protein-L-isoaspartate(D-aspartate) O-methyltransferase
VDAQSLIRRLRAEGIRDERVLSVMGRVPRERFVPPPFRQAAYEDRPLPIGHDQTVSQPFVVARMTELLAPSESARVLEIGTGSGYQTAVLAEIAAAVYTIEIVPELAERARETLAALGYTNIHYRVGDGSQGWLEEAPFDGIVVTAAPERIPENLVAQLQHGAPLVIPVGQMESQQLVLLRRTMNGVATVEAIFPVRFVPMTGEGG